jgi:hypothetical protein
MLTHPDRRERIIAEIRPRLQAPWWVFNCRQLAAHERIQAWRSRQLDRSAVSNPRTSPRPVQGR